MSTTVDKRVVEMQFNNKNFEKNVATTMSTLDKLKEKLKFKNGSNGLKEINMQAQNVNFNSMANAIDLINRRFSTMGIVGTTALVNITNTALNFAKRTARSVIGSITTAGKARAQNLENARFQLRGLMNDEEKVAAVMEDVNYGVQDTAYSLDAAATVAAQLAASGMEAGENMQHTLRGISGVAAMTNSTYEEIGGIYTTIAGNGRLMTEQLLQLSTRGMNAAAILGQQLGYTEAEIREMVSKGKIDFQTFANAMDDAFGEHAKAANETFTGAMANIRAALAKIGAEFYSPLIEQNGPVVKMLNAIREHINKIKTAIIPLAKVVTNFINAIATKIANFINAINSSPLGRIKDTLNTVSVPLKKAGEAVSTVTSSLQDLNEIATRVIRGDFLNSPHRLGLLTEAGYNYYEVQNKVNEMLGISYRHSQELIDQQNEILGVTNKNVDANGNVEVSLSDLNDEQKKYIASLTKKSKAELKSLGYSKDQINALKQLDTYSKKTGLSIEYLIDNIDNISAHSLFLNALSNIGKNIYGVFKAIGEAFGEVFSVSAVNGITNFVMWFNKLTTSMLLNEKSLNRIKETFTNLFRIIKLLIDIAVIPLKVAMVLLNRILAPFGKTLGSVTGTIGDGIDVLNQFIEGILDWIDKNELLNKTIEFLVNGITTVVELFYGWAKNSEFVQQSILVIKNALKQLSNYFINFKNEVKGVDTTPQYILKGLANGIVNGAQIVLKVMSQLALEIIKVVCEKLGIHSPSTVFAWIGQNVILGFVEGIKKLASFLYSTVINIFENLGNIISNIDWGKVIGVGFGAGVLLIIKNILDLGKAAVSAADKFAELPAGIGKAAEGLGEMFSAFGKAREMKARAKQMDAIANIIKSLGISLLLVAAALYIVSKIDQKDLWRSVGAMAALAVIIAGITVALALLTKTAGGLKDVSVGMIAMSASLFIFAVAMEKLGKVNVENAINVLLGLGGIILALIGVSAAMRLLTIGKSKITPSQIEKFAQLLQKFASAMLILAIAMKILGSMSENEANRATSIIIALTSVLGVMTVITRFGKSVDKAGAMYKKLAESLLLLVVVVKLCGLLNAEDMLKGVVVMTMFGVFAAAMITVSKNAGKDADKAGRMLLAVSGALLIMSAAIFILGNMSVKTLAKGIIAIGFMGAIIAGLIYISKYSTSDSSKATLLILAASACFVAMGLMVFVLGNMDVETLAKGTVVITVLSAILAGLIYVSKYSKEANLKPLLAIIGALALLILAIVGLSFIEPNRLLATTTGLSMVLLSFAAMMVVVGKMKALDGKTYVTLVALLGVILVLSGIVIVLSKLAPEGAIASATSLAILIGALAVAMGAMSLFGSTASSGLAAMGILTLIVAGLAAILILMSKMDVYSALPNAVALSTLLISMSAALAILTLVGLGGPAAFVGLAALGTLIVGLTAILVGLGYLVDKFPKLEEFIDKGGKLFDKLGTILGTFFGNVVGGFINGVGESLPKFGMQLSLFMTNLTPFIIGAKMIDDSVANGLKTLIISIGLLTAEKFISGITSIMSVTSWRSFGQQLSDFMEGAQGFIKGAKKIDESSMKGAQALVSIINSLAGAKLKNAGAGFLTGLTKAFFGDSGETNTIEEQFISIGKGLKALKKSTKGLTDDDLGRIELISKIIKTLTKASSGIENSGGWVSKIMGDNDLGTFGESLGKLGMQLLIALPSFRSITDEDMSVINRIAKIIKTLNKAGSKIENAGGLAGVFAGNNDLGAFGEQLFKLGKGLTDLFADDFTLTDDNMSTVEKLVTIIKTLSSSTDGLDNMGGIVTWFTGDNSISALASRLPDLGKNVKKMLENIGDSLNKSSNTTINNLVKIISSLVELGSIDIKTFANKVDDLGASLSLFASYLLSYVGKMNKIKLEDIEKANLKSKSVFEGAKSITDAKLNSNLKSFGQALKTFANEGVKKYTEVFNNDKNKTITNAITNMIKTTKNALEDNKTSLKTKFRDIAKHAVGGMDSRGVIDSAALAGENVAKGLIKGIKNKYKSAYNAGITLGQQVTEGAKSQKSLNEHSPSKVFEGIGEFAGEGLVIGIENYNSKAFDAGTMIGSKAKAGLYGAISKISDVIENGIDAQPTIRPVLDLSDVEDGVGGISSLFSNNVMNPNLGAISYGMSTNRQNGNDEVVTAINRLRKDISDMPGTTNNYTVNGVTYDDGSNITNAVGTLINAINVERRA